VTKHKQNKQAVAMIVGISGQDGAYLAKLLLDKGYEVWGTARDAQMATFNNLAKLGIKERVHSESMSLNDFRSVLQMVSKIAPDELYNLAGQSSVGLSFDQPVETLESISTGTLNLLEVIRFVGKPIRFYNAGSSECFGDTEDAPANESTPFHPQSPYAVAKAAAYWLVANYREAYGLYACSGMLFNHESPLRPERFVTRKIVSTACRIAHGSDEKLQLGAMNISRDWGWAPEYVEAMWRMLQLNVPEDFVIATGRTYCLEEFVAEAFMAVNLDWRDHVQNDPSLLRPSDILVGRADPTKAKEMLDWQAEYQMHDVVCMMIQAELKEL